MKTRVVLALFLIAGVSLGDIQKRIINGRKCKAEEEKHFVFLETESTSLHKRSICSGSIIGNGQWVLTAKHCDAYGAPFTIKDVKNNKETSSKVFKHPVADIMLIKLNAKKSAIALASPTDCTDVKNQLASTKSVKMLVVARDTKGTPDTTMCGDIELRGCAGEAPSGVECFYGPPVGCQICGGDSGAGYLYDNALYAVETGDGTIGSQSVDYGHTVCDASVRQWIEDTMKKN
ncbi:serine protease 1-like [Cololabis saira]|uniref:serine protease 1-like n=1 Tax=Cololabis saira TaxID=129043 RepID=UPI002AD28964|nr:serine protease 1-like [Cololabis saira]